MIESTAAIQRYINVIHVPIAIHTLLLRFEVKLLLVVIVLQKFNIFKSRFLGTERLLRHIY